MLDLLRMYLGQGQPAAARTQGVVTQDPPGPRAPGTTAVPGGFGPPINPRQDAASSMGGLGIMHMQPGWLGQLLGPQGEQGLMGQRQGLLEAIAAGRARGEGAGLLAPTR